MRALLVGISFGCMDIMDILFLLFLPSVVSLGFQSFEGKVFILSTKFGMGVYWVNSLHGIAFGEESSIAN